jgi:hypothetical protein
MKMKPGQNDSSFVGAFLFSLKNIKYIDLYLSRSTAAYWLVLTQLDTHKSLVVPLFDLNDS